MILAAGKYFMVITVLYGSKKRRILETAVPCCLCHAGMLYVVPLIIERKYMASSFDYDALILGAGPGE